MVVALVVRFDLVDEASAERFDDLTGRAVAAITAKEPGTLVYATHTVQGAPLSRMFYEVYADEAAFQAHEQAPHVIDFHAEKEPLLSGAPVVHFLTPGPTRGLLRS
jgi:quinol monooxygenase YgiN